MLTIALGILLALALLAVAKLVSWGLLYLAVDVAAKFFKP